MDPAGDHRHGGGPPVSPGKPLAQEYKEENLGLLEAGVCNLQRHIRSAAKFGVPVVVAINKFHTVRVGAF
jgi:formyltetrahydrofolate synthetase